MDQDPREQLKEQIEAVLRRFRYTDELMTFEAADLILAVMDDMDALPETKECLS